MNTSLCQTLKIVKYVVLTQTISIKICPRRVHSWTVTLSDKHTRLVPSVRGSRVIVNYAMMTKPRYQKLIRLTVPYLPPSFIQTVQ